ncbi:MAG: hypothetical protein HOP28_04040 [Gemmatimonadales bacterium]|nr:hypothetical protein [Gemmatimonadales bacterium]
MTFYGVVFGVLFLAAVQGVLLSLGSPRLLPSATLVAIVFNDVIFATHVLEQGRRYSIPLKLLDLVAFILAVYALLVLNPAENPFQVDVSLSLPGVDRPPVFWGLLTAYWIVALIWNCCARQGRESHWSEEARVLMFMIVFALAVSAFIDRGKESFADMNGWTSFAPLVIVIGYMVLKACPSRHQKT